MNDNQLNKASPDVEAGESSAPLLNVLVAHMPEARPLIKQYQLAPFGDKSLKLFSNNKGISLMVSGNGCEAMRAAARALNELQGEFVAPAWLNVGIAGHGALPVGAGILINKLRDQQSNACFYPTPLPERFPVSELLTVAEVEHDYSEPIAYDMEAVAFWEEASRYGQLDLVHCFKIISDNPEQPVAQFDISNVATLYAGVQDSLGKLIKLLLDAASGYRALHDRPVMYEELTARTHFTVSQRVQLEKLLRSAIALKIIDLVSGALTDMALTSASAILQSLRQTIHSEAQDAAVRSDKDQSESQLESESESKSESGAKSPAECSAEPTKAPVN
jgi:hypothetical protein